MRSRHKSVYQMLGLPQEFGVVLLTLGLILAVGPYLTGADFGVFKVPDFPEETRAAFRVLGPLAFLVVVGLFLPVWKPKRARSSDERAGGERR